MNREIRPEEVLNALRPWLRDDYRRAFESGLSWGWPRCRTDEERLLYPLLLAALSPYTAIVAHRRMPEGEVASLLVSLSQSTPDGVRRFRCLVSCGEGDHVGEENTEESELSELSELSVRLTAQQVQEQPWQAAAQVVSAIQRHLLNPNRS